MDLDRLDTPQGRTLAVSRQPGRGPAILFLGGFGSDMTGTKAAWLADWSRKWGRAFVRFDYSGHGASGGAFADGTVGAWAEDADAVMATLPGPAVLVGSSMGAWLALLVARAKPDRVAGLVTIAAAPDFTEDLWDAAPAAFRERLAAEGRVAMPSDRGAATTITAALIEDGRANLVLRRPLPLPFPVRMLQGTGDREVPVATALRLLDHAAGPDIRLTLVQGADHRFSSPRCLGLVARSIEEVS